MKYLKVPLWMATTYNMVIDTATSQGFNAVPYLDSPNGTLVTDPKESRVTGENSYTDCPTFFAELEARGKENEDTVTPGNEWVMEENLVEDSEIGFPEPEDPGR